MPRLSIDQKVLEAILNNIAERPYKEVAPIFAAVQRDVKPIPEPEAKADPEAGQPSKVVSMNQKPT